MNHNWGKPWIRITIGFSPKLLKWLLKVLNFCAISDPMFWWQWKWKTLAQKIDQHWRPWAPIWRICWATGFRLDFWSLNRLRGKVHVQCYKRYPIMKLYTQSKIGQIWKWVRYSCAFGVFRYIFFAKLSDSVTVEWKSTLKRDHVHFSVKSTL